MYIIKMPRAQNLAYFSDLRQGKNKSQGTQLYSTEKAAKATKYLCVISLLRRFFQIFLTYLEQGTIFERLATMFVSNTVCWHHC